MKLYILLVYQTQSQKVNTKILYDAFRDLPDEFVVISMIPVLMTFCLYVRSADVLAYDG